MAEASSVRTIYRLLSRAEYEALERSGVFRGSAHDERDGFIHFSTAAQLAETARKHYEGRADLVLVFVDLAGLAGDLKWEISRGGALFPHLYAELRWAAVLRAEPLALDAAGLHLLPHLD